MVKLCTFRSSASIYMLTASLLLSACQQPAIHGCPPIPTWTAAERAQLAAEVRELPDGTMLERATNEYTVMRDQARDCR